MSLHDIWAEAHRLVAEAHHLRQYGERAPGGAETWREWDRKADAYLQGLLGEQDTP